METFYRRFPAGRLACIRQIHVICRARTTRSPFSEPVTDEFRFGSLSDGAAR
jgi:hypothetical protein